MWQLPHVIPLFGATQLASVESSVEALTLALTADDILALDRAFPTVAALRDKNYKYAYPAALTASAEKFSDRARAKLGAGAKDKLENALGIGHDRNYYGPALEKLGWKITPVNDNDPNHLEYEIVKGDQSHAAMGDFDAGTKKATAADVETNIWEAERTEKVKGDE